MQPNTGRLSHHALIGHTPGTRRWSSWTRATAADSPVCLVRALHAPWSEAAIDIRGYHGLAIFLAAPITNRRFILEATWRRRSAHGPTSTKVGSDCRLGGIWLIFRSRKPTRASAMQIIRSTTTQQGSGDRRRHKAPAPNPFKSSCRQRIHPKASWLALAAYCFLIRISAFPS